ncbi:MAG TPA: NADPH-dependent FMN reductase [Rhodanobacteraceae bacterium]|nr:NADPH-dependent FMN reductase [Rhodanobacteraceae bacterium]
MTDAVAPRRRVLCLCGSLRRVSANRAALEAARELAPRSLRLDLYGNARSLPLFDPDVEAGPLPQAVRELREAVGHADALLIACPEYAHGIPGAFKNLLDWLVGALEFPGKPVLLLNTSARGSQHAQDALMEVLKTMSARLLSADPLSVRLPGSGCNVDAVLGSDDRRCEIEVALGVLAAGLA